MSFKQKGDAFIFEKIDPSPFSHSETDFRADMARIDVPTLVIHGDDDQIVPFEATGKLAGAPLGFAATHGQALNEDLLAFLAG